MIRKYLKLFVKFTALDLSARMAYKWDFVIKCFALFLMDIISPLLALLIYSNTPGIPGWSLEEFILFQGTFMLVLGLNHALTIRIPGQCIDLIRTGNFDSILTKPFKPLMYITFSSADMDGFMEVITGIAVIVWAAAKIKVDILSGHFISYLMLLAVAFLFQYAITVLMSSLAFIVVKSWALFDIFFSLSNLAKYPLSIYHPSIVFMLTFLFPAAITAHYPVEALLRGMSIVNMAMVSIPVIIFFIVALVMWDVAMKKYSSAGG